MPVDVQIAVAHDRLHAAANEVEDDLIRWSEAVTDTVAASGGSNPEVCVRLVEEEESRALNVSYRGKDKPTNVLSFPAAGEAAGPLHEDLDLGSITGLEILGDIVICVPVVEREAREQRKTLRDHLAHMVVHGMLHLYGFDHERDEASRLEMESIEREILDRFGMSDPYREL